MLGGTTWRGGDILGIVDVERRCEREGYKALVSNNTKKRGGKGVRPMMMNKQDDAAKVRIKVSNS